MVARDPAADLDVVRNPSPAFHATLALITATILPVYKPRGTMRYGWRKRHEERTGAVLISANTVLVGINSQLLRCIEI